MQKVQLSPELADAADVLSDQLRTHLQRLAVLVEPHAEKLERKFAARLRSLGFDTKQRTALSAITLGAAARILARGYPASNFIEQVEYNGRRLAKLSLPPSSVLESLEEYDRLLTPVIQSLITKEQANFRWVREQLTFCVILTLNNAYYQVRESETKTFFELSRIELESRTLGELLRRFLECLVHVYHADVGRLYMLNQDSSAWVLKAGAPKPEPFAVQNGARLMGRLSRPQYVNGDGRHSSTVLDKTWQKRYQSCWSIPLASGNRTAGVLQLGFTKQHEWLPREVELLAAAAERCLMAAEKQRLVEDLAAREEQVRHLAEHMLHVEEIERQRISRELHDEAGQSLLCIRLQMELIEQTLPENAGESRIQLTEARGLMERTILEMRRLIAALSPAVLEQLGLGAAVRQLVSRFRRLYACRARLHIPRLKGLSQQLEAISYRLAQECLNNIAKHSAAKQVNISLGTADGKLRLTVEDDGIGFDVAAAFARRDSFGLQGMRERVALLGGKFQVESRMAGNNTGTKISVELPIPQVETQRK